MNDALIASIGKMLPEGNRLALPQDEQFTNYPQVKKALQNAGGKYKRGGYFEFAEPADTVQARLVGGEVINDRKTFQFFPTPEELARRLIQWAQVTAGQRVLEPSAGQGAIADLLRELGVDLTLVELMPQNVQALIRKGYQPHEADFLTLTARELKLFDRIIANPPFTRNQDIDHIQHMYSLLKPGGRLVSVASNSWTFGNQKKQVAFRAWLTSVGGRYEDLPADSFKASGTQVNSVCVIIEKAA